MWEEFFPLYRIDFRANPFEAKKCDAVMNNSIGENSPKVLGL